MARRIQVIRGQISHFLPLLRGNGLAFEFSIAQWLVELLPIHIALATPVVRRTLFTLDQLANWSFVWTSIISQFSPPQFSLVTRAHSALSSHLALQHFNKRKYSLLE